MKKFLKRILSISLSLTLILSLAIPSLNFSAVTVKDYNIQEITFTDNGDLNSANATYFSFEDTGYESGSGSVKMTMTESSGSWPVFTPAFTYEADRKYKLTYWHKENDKSGTYGSGKTYFQVKYGNSSLKLTNYSANWQNIASANTFTANSTDKVTFTYYPGNNTTNGRGNYEAWLDNLVLTPYYNFAVGTAIGGSGQVSAAEALAETQVTFIAIAEDGYKFVEWQDADGNPISVEAIYKIDKVTKDLTLTPVFEALDISNVSIEESLEDVIKTVDAMDGKTQLTANELTVTATTSGSETVINAQKFTGVWYDGEGNAVANINEVAPGNYTYYLELSAPENYKFADSVTVGGQPVTPADSVLKIEICKAYISVLGNVNQDEAVDLRDLLHYKRFVNNVADVTVNGYPFGESEDTVQNSLTLRNKLLGK